jgi:3D (Asp-Asp-Asp) domain-containing protein
MKKILSVLILGLLMNSSFAGVEVVFARATKYYKTDRNCDPETKKGLTSTKIRLGDSCDRTIGMVAVDPQRIPYGSLIYSPQAKRFFLACDIGGDVSARTAAKKLAKQKKLPSKYYEALVLDFYAPREIIDNHFCDFFVIKHEGKDFRFKMTKKEQDLRLDPRFWLERAERIYNEGKDDNSEILREIIKELKEIK